MEKKFLQILILKVSTVDIEISEIVFEEFEPGQDFTKTAYRRFKFEPPIQSFLNLKHWVMLFEHFSCLNTVFFKYIFADLSTRANCEFVSFLDNKKTTIHFWILKKGLSRMQQVKLNISWSYVFSFFKMLIIMRRVCVHKSNKVANETI